MRSKQDRDSRNQRVCEYARKNPEIGMPEIGEAFGITRGNIAYILKHNAPDLYAARKGRRV